jgi:hypothetical protein
MDFSSADYRYFNYGYTWGKANRNYSYTRRIADVSLRPDGTEPPQAKSAHA